jgi:hypothetical protein
MHSSTVSWYGWNARRWNCPAGRVFICHLLGSVHCTAAQALRGRGGRVGEYTVNGNRNPRGARHTDFPSVKPCVVILLIWNNLEDAWLDALVSGRGYFKEQVLSRHTPPSPPRGPPRLCTSTAHNHESRGSAGTVLVYK